MALQQNGADMNHGRRHNRLGVAADHTLLVSEGVTAFSVLLYDTSGNLLRMQTT